MEHHMHLDAGPFERIKTGSKTIELRLLDEKRQKLAVGDLIEFYCRDDDTNLMVKIVDLLYYDRFADLIDDYGSEYYGHPKDYPEEKIVKSMDDRYPQEKQEQLGVVGIVMKLTPSKTQNV